MVCVKPSRLDPQSWGPGFNGPVGFWEARTDDTAVNILTCRAPCRSPRRRDMTTKTYGHRGCVSPFSSRHSGAPLLEERLEANLHLVFFQRDVTDGMRSPRNFLFLWCQSVFRRWSKSWRKSRTQCIVFLDWSHEDC